MGSIFDIDPSGAEALDLAARLNPLRPEDQAPPMWQGSGEAFKGFLRPSAGAGRTLMMAGAPVAMAIDEAMKAGDWLGGRTARREELGLGEKDYGVTDWYFRNVVDDLGSEATDYWTPDPAAMGSAAKAINVGGNVAGSIPQMFGTMPLFLANSAFDPATELVRQGVDSDAALGVGAISLGVTAVGVRLPAAFGSTLATRVATGAGSNLALGVGADAASRAVLDGGGYTEQAQGYDPGDPYARAMDVLMGAAFGWKANVDAARAPVAQRDAVLTARNNDHLHRLTMPGDPATAGAQRAHGSALSDAIAQVLRGEQVNIADAINPADFVLRPELRQEPATSGFSPGFEASVARVLRDEGGYVNDPDDRGGATNFGISSRAHPDVDVATLTREQATELYRERYWRAIDADTLPADMQGVAFDAAVNHGVGWTRRALADADGDVGAFLKAREQKYRAIVEADPSQRKFLRGWLNRLGRYAEGNEAGVVLSDDLDAPNFGLPDPPRTIADDDPFWKAIPDGEKGRETLNIRTPEREAMRDTWVDEHFANAQPRQLAEGERPIAWVMGGGGASGKGTILAWLKDQGEVPRTGAVEIDPDAIKVGKHGLSGIPEYREMVGRGDSRAAAVVHEESSHVAQRVRERAVEGKYDLVLDRTLGNRDKGLDELRKLKEAGYEVRLFGVTVDPGTAIRRAVKRAQGAEGRFVPLGELLKAHRGFADAFDEYAALADEARLFDNSGTVHRSVAESAPGGLQIADEQAYNSFRGRSKINAEATTHRALEAETAWDAVAGSDARGVQPGEGSQGPRGPGERSPERLEAGDRGAGAPQGEAGLDPQRFPVQGDEVVVVTERGLRVQVRYAVTDASKLVTSHDDALNQNPDFPAELQPRDRARAASEQQITRIANSLNPELLAQSPKAADGAPIVGADGVVESGNARTIAVRRAYSGGKAEAYRQFLIDNAARFGLDPAAVSGIEQPVLVRVATGEGRNRAEFARQANEQTVASMSATEQAVADARALPDMAGLVANDDGTINMRASGRFVQGFIESAVGPNERATMSTASGDLSQQGQARIRSAVFAKAYGDADLVAMMAEATDANVKNILAGMLRAAPEIARLRQMIDEGGRVGPDITPDLVAAVRKFSQLRSEGTTVEQFEAQGDFFGSGGLNPNAMDLLRTVSENARAPKRMAEFLQRYVAAVDALGDPRQADLMGGQGLDATAALRSAGEATRAANDAPPPRSPGMFNAAGRPTADAAQARPAVETSLDAVARVASETPDAVAITGFDADGAPIYRPMAEALAEIQAERTRAANDAEAIPAAVSCFLRRGA